MSSAEQRPEDLAGHATQDRWGHVQALEGLAGETRLNLIRLAANILFYAHHLVNVFLFADDPTLVGQYHATVTSLVVAWSAVVLGIYLCTARGWIGPWTKYAATAADTLLITVLVALSGGPKSTLSVLYFLVVAAAGLRLSLRLVYASTLGGMAAYVVLLAHDALWRQLPAQEQLSRPNQVIFVLALATTGLLVGQVVRQARRVVRAYPWGLPRRKEE